MSLEPCCLKPSSKKKTPSENVHKDVFTTIPSSSSYIGQLFPPLKRVRHISCMIFSYLVRPQGCLHFSRLEVMSFS